ncbi:MAG: hypothetical protein Q9227_001739 [Pyrenula ochraceoflavens]
MLMSIRPVGLKEAALDSPTFRASTIHFAEQVEAIESWLDGYSRSATRVAQEIATFESVVNTFLGNAVLSTSISESIIDHDYSLLALKKYGEGSKDFWASTIITLKKLHSLVVEPIRHFLANDVRNFKEVRRSLDANQKSFDSLLSRYASQAKSKEPSSLREDAFQLHEARKAYLKSSMDFCTSAPQLRATLDKLLVHIFYGQWREMRVARDNAAATFARCALDMERVKGWSNEMDTSEKAFKRELQAARKQLEETAESAARPSRELDDYSASTVPFLGKPSVSATSLNVSATDQFEKQGWVNLRTYTGKPTRTVWVRRWAFVKDGIFGWLVQGNRSAGVEESERVGVLLCNVRPAFQEERRFCFEVKTTKNAMMLQADTQAELTGWIGVFETAKKKALEDPAATASLIPGRANHQDPAFSISQSPFPEFAASVTDILNPGGNEDSTLDRSSTLPVPGVDGLAGSIEPSSRRSTALDREDPPREHTSRIKQRLDLHRKSAATSQSAGVPATPTAGGGIASLIAASHGSLPVGPGMQARNADQETAQQKSTFVLALRDMPASSLAPATLIDPPSSTGLSKTAVIVSGERGLRADHKRDGGMPPAMLANLWGSSNWGYINRLEPGEKKLSEINLLESTPPVKPSGSPPKLNVPREGIISETVSTEDLPTQAISRTPSPKPLQHRQTISLDGDAAKIQRASLNLPLEFPNYYPLQLRTQDAQFRLLFPGISRDERLVMVFRATWNPNDQQEFPGRVYVTMSGIYFYSNHIGLVLTNYLKLNNVAEVTAAPGRDCDFLFLHLRDPKNDGSPTRVTIKTFLEPLRLLQKRLNFLIENDESDNSQDLENVIKSLIKMEQETGDRSPSLESWEDVSLNTPVDDGTSFGRRPSSRRANDLKAPVHVDRTLDNHRGKGSLAQQVAKFKLPSQPVEYVPSGNLRMTVEKLFNVSPKALFHVLFGDRSAVWQLLQHERRAQHIKQGPWTSLEKGHMRREFEFTIESRNWLGSPTDVTVHDYQVVDAMNDHLCYVVTDKRTAWHLPFKRNFRLMSKIVITHVAKSRSKIAIFTKVEWLRAPPILQAVIEKQAMNDLELDALDLVDLVTDQVRRLGPNSRTKKAIQIFGHIGQQSQTTQFQADASQLVEIEPRRLPEQKTLVFLIRQTLGSLLQSVVGSFMVWAFGVLRWIWKTCSANSVILFVLVLSAAFNMFYTSIGASGWWRERKASNFMARMGVHPNSVMSKAVYVHDLETITTPSLASDMGLPWADLAESGGAGACYETFYEANHLEDLDTPIIPSYPSSPPASTAASPARRLQKTRQRLGMHRHDLLVAMRVVDSIEREAVLSEWEKWVVGENRRCAEVGELLKRNGTEGMGGKRKREEVQEWFEGYCGSCREARDGI